MVSKPSRKILNWKAPERDGDQGFWIKNLKNLHERTAFQLNKILNGNEQFADWLTYGRTVLCQKDRTKRYHKGPLSTHLLFAITEETFDRRSTNLAMAWIDCRKSHDMIPHSWICECHEVFGVAENTKNFLVNSMNKWKLESTSNRVPLGNAEIRGGNFRGRSLSPLLFVLCMVSLSLILRKVKFHYELW